ncbi:hypothetical protein NIES23_64310 (plasmid) [Trichormus variabilis NIES-23]|uniref:Uncharacterized protein n=1 Tax=Trichormus variabilis NIES-23 TaxID=1973479 RepID=A0A1Z4KX92_ANAVA|nr:hypothetical protein NIES23_64310 [Trichormus variabilis NIES-23]
MTNPTRQEATEKRRNRTKKADKPILETVTDVVSNVASKVAETAQNFDTITSTIQNIPNSVKAPSIVTTQNSNQSYQSALELAGKLGVATFNPAEHLGTDPYKADSNIPQMTGKEANQHLKIIQQQTNALEVRQAKTELNRKVFKVADSTAKLVQDAVKYATTQIEVGMTFLENQIADTRYQTVQSKLRQQEEYLQQQQNATLGTIALTNPLRERTELQLELAQAENERLKLQIEGKRVESDIVREQLEAKLLFGQSL